MADSDIRPAKQKRKLPMDITGEVYSRLTAVCFVGPGPNRKRLWKFKCECGGEIIVPTGAVRSGNTRSCGCLKHEAVVRNGQKMLAASHAAQVTHGMTGTPLHRTWKNMKGRCHNPNRRDYGYYGGRGIFVCEEWKNDSSAFINWALANGYQIGLEIDRINNDGPYSPDNCRWATRREQTNNHRRNHFIEHNGKRLTLSQWDRELGWPESTVANRISGGYSEIEAITIPRGKKRKFFRAT